MTMYRVVWHGVTVMETGNEALAREVAAEAHAKLVPYKVDDKPRRSKVEILFWSVLIGQAIYAIVIQ